MATDIWQRLSPIAIVFYLVTFVRHAIGNGWAALAPAFAWAATLDASDRWMALSAAAILTALALIFAVLSYLRFRFRIAEDAVQVRRGILHREQLTIEISRVQNVHLREPFYVRPFDLVVMELETAGSAKKEVALGGIPGTLARQLRDRVVRSRDGEPVSGETPATACQPRTLLNLGHREMVVYGLCHSTLVWIALAAAAVIESMESELARIGAIAMSVVRTFVAQDSSWRFALTGAAVVIALGLFAGLSIFATYWRFYRYRLTADGDTYTRSSGLLNRYEQSLQRNKVQAAVLTQNALMRLFGRVNLQLRQVSAGIEGEIVAGAKKSVFLIPAIIPANGTSLCREILPGSHPDRAVYTRPQRRFVPKVLYLQIGIPLLLATTALAVILNFWFCLLFPLGMAAAYPLVWLRWRWHGYAVIGDYAYVRSGFVGSRHTLFLLSRVQRVDLHQSPGQYRRDLANLTLHLPSHSVTLYYLDLTQAEKLRDLALYAAESSTAQWI